MRDRCLQSGLTPAAALVIALALAGCAHSPPSDPLDPLEPINRRVFQFNDRVDRYAVRPLAKAYVAVTPDPVERGIGNFFSNLFYPITIVNDLLQLKFRHGLADSARFVVNSTVGVAGIFDVASRIGLEERDEDFGQTLGYWGLGQGVYLVLPILGPSTGRDLVGDVADYFADPTTYIDDTATELALYALYGLDLRAGFLDYDRNLRDAFDPYSFMRTAYLQNRLGKVHDGNPPRERLDAFEHE